MMKIFKWLANALGLYLAYIPHWFFLWHISALALLLRCIDRRRHKDALANLNFVYGEAMSARQKKAIIKRLYKNFVFVLLESARVPFIPLEKHLARFDFINEEYLSDSLKNHNGVVLVSAHFGYWEAMATAIAPHYSHCNTASLGRLTPFRAVNELIIERREIYGVKFIDKKGAFKHLLKLYAAGNVITGILIDQNISASEGIWVEFFGKRATHTSIASVLSRRFNVGVVPVMIGINEDYTRFEARFYKPIYCQKSEDSVRDILECTQAQADVIERAIREKPQDWFWFHKRFKSAYGEIYKH